MTMTHEAPAQAGNGNGNEGQSRAMNLRAPVQDAMTLKRLLERSKQQLADVLPRHMTPERIMKVALIAVNKTPKLLQCSMESVLQSIMQAAAIGLDPGGALGEAYLVPYGNTCQLIPGYRGLISLARRSGEIQSISADVVYAGDKFVYRKGTEPVLLHEPDIMAEQRDSDIIGAYMVAHLKDGGKHVEFMNRQQINKIRKGSRAGGNGPWVDHFSEMCRKTVVRRGCKYLPISSERLASALELDNELDAPESGMGMSIGTQQKGVAGLLGKITSKPVSENQQFEPTTEALEEAQRAEAEQRQADPLETLKSASPSTQQQAPELPAENQAVENGDEGGEGAEGQQAPKPATAEEVDTPEKFMDACTSAGMNDFDTPEEFQKWMNGRLMLVGKKGKLKDTSVDWRIRTLNELRAR